VTTYSRLLDSILKFMTAFCAKSCLSQIDCLLCREVTTDQTVVAENNL